MTQHLGGPEVLGRFVVFEGLDGAGTTTQAQRLAEYLANQGPAEFTFEPTERPTGKVIRQLLVRHVAIDPKTLAYLFAADRNEHLFNPVSGIVKRLEEGYTVVCDRYVFSSLAYQGAEVPVDLVESLNGRFPLPEHLVFIDVPVEVAESRRKTRLMEEERYEHRQFQEQVYRRYRELLTAYVDTGMKIHRINGDRSEDDVFQDIVASLA